MARVVVKWSKEYCKYVRDIVGVLSYQNHILHNPTRAASAAASEEAEEEKFFKTKYGVGCRFLFKENYGITRMKKQGVVTGVAKDPEVMVRLHVNLKPLCIIEGVRMK